MYRTTSRFSSFTDYFPMPNASENCRKEAQRCFCEATNCRGWIGDNPDDNKEEAEYLEDVEDMDDDTEDMDDDVEDKEEDKENKELKPVKKVRRKRGARKISEHMEDEDVSLKLQQYFQPGLEKIMI